jgi:hypothetical protein
MIEARPLNEANMLGCYRTTVKPRDITWPFA